MKNKIATTALTLGLTVFPCLAGGWTTSNTVEELPELSNDVVCQEQYTDIDWGTAVQPLSLIPDYSEAYINLSIGDSIVHLELVAQQAGLNATDRINFSINVVTGDGPQCRFKVLYFWGNDVVNCGSEVPYGPFTVGSAVYTETLWCDRGGIPTDTGTSNKRWNCNFAVIMMQFKLDGHVYLHYDFINWKDSNDTFVDNYLYTNIKDYYAMFSTWWWAGQLGTEI